MELGLDHLPVMDQFIHARDEENRGELVALHRASKETLSVSMASVLEERFNQDWEKLPPLTELGPVQVGLVFSRSLDHPTNVYRVKYSSKV